MPDQHHHGLLERVFPNDGQCDGQRLLLGIPLRLALVLVHPVRKVHRQLAADKQDTDGGGNAVEHQQWKKRYGRGADIIPDRRLTISRD